MTRSFRLLNTCLLGSLALAVGCRDQSPPAPPSPAVAPPLEVAANDELVFTYLGPDGRFRSTAKIDEIPAGARAVVRVVDPRQAPGARGDLERVYVADLRRPAPSGRYPTRLVDRDVFETAAQALLPPGDGSKFAFRHSPGAAPGPPPHGRAPAPAAAPAAPALRNRDRIILYGTSWCGSCARARAYLKRRGISFDDKDVERDPAAAAELSSKAARAGIQPDRVPVLDVRGTLLQGFDEKRLEALLGVPI